MRCSPEPESLPFLSYMSLKPLSVSQQISEYKGTNLQVASLNPGSARLRTARVRPARPPKAGAGNLLGFWHYTSRVYDVH